MKHLLAVVILAGVLLNVTVGQQQNNQLNTRQVQQRRAELIMQQAEHRRQQQQKAADVDVEARTIDQGTQNVNDGLTQNKKPVLNQLYNGEIEVIPEDTSITDIDMENFELFLADEKSVRILVECFLTPAKCRHSSITNLLKQVRNLGLGGRCKNCTADQQEDINNKIYRFIYIFQNKYKSYWRMLLPHLGFILGSRKV